MAPDGRRPAGDALVEPEPPRGGGPGRRGHGARVPGRAGRRRRASAILPVLIHGDAAFAARASWRRRSTCRGSRGYRTAAPSTSSSTTRSASPPGPDETALDALLHRPREERRGADPARERRLSRVRAARDPRGVRLPRRVRRATPSWTSSATGAGATTRGDEPAYTQPLLYAQDPQAPVGARALRAPPRHAAAQMTRGGARWSPSRRFARSSRRALDSFQARRRRPQRRAPRPSTSRIDDPSDYDDGRRRPRPASPRPRASCVAVADASRTPRASSCTRTSRASSRGAWRWCAASSRVDWGCAEAMAFGSLLLEGVPIRLAGQDSGARHVQPAPRGHRRPGDRDASTSRSPPGAGRRALRGVEQPRSPRRPRSGFEFGYAVAAPASARDVGGAVRRLLQRRADPDRPVHRGRRKRSGSETSGVVLLLPHGYDGQGPEHSSARLERFLQLCAERQHDASPTARRRPSTSTCCAARALAREKRPLVVMTPKSLLKKREAASPVARRSTRPLPSRSSRRPRAAAARDGGSCSARARSTTTSGAFRAENKIGDVAVIRRRAALSAAARARCSRRSSAMAASAARSAGCRRSRATWAPGPRCSRGSSRAGLRAGLRGRAAAASPATGSMTRAPGRAGRRSCRGPSRHCPGSPRRSGDQARPEPSNSVYDRLAPLIAHIVYRFDVGGLENGLVNLINHIPTDRYRHVIISLTETSAFESRINQPGVHVIPMHKQVGPRLERCTCGSGRC